MRRGFNLFSIFVGISMLAIALAVSFYAYQAQQHRIDMMAPRAFAYESASVADFVRDDAIATLNTRIRAEFQRFFETQILNPPPDAWNNPQKFTDWFTHDLAASDTFATWFAHRLALELQNYQDVRVGDYTISVQADEKRMAAAIKHGSQFIILPDGTFAYVLDTDKLTPADYASLPQLVLSKGFASTKFPVFPRKKWSVYVPLRIFRAYMEARRAREAVMQSINKYKLAIGACTAECPMCAIYDFSGPQPERIFPAPSQKKGCFLSTEEDLPEEGKEKPVFLGGVQHACIDQYLDMNLAVKTMGLPSWVASGGVPCFTGEKSNQYHIDQKAFALYEILEYRLAQVAKGLGKDVRIDVDPGSFRIYRTMRVCSQKAISLSAFVASQVPGMEWLLKKIGKITGLDFLTQGTIGLSPCEQSGYLTCAAPTNFSVVITWTDPDLNYSVTKNPATFHFRVNLAKYFTGMDAELSALQDEVNSLPKMAEQKPIKVKESDAKKLDKDCVNRMLADCMVQYYRAYAECNADASLRKEMETDVNNYYNDNPKNPLWSACGLGHWPKRPSLCKWFYVEQVAEIPSPWSLDLALPQVKDVANSKILGSYFSSFVPAVQKYADEENHLIQGGKIQATDACRAAVATLLAMYGNSGLCATWKNMRSACMSLSLNRKSWYPACPASKHTAYSTFWLHIFSEPVATCSYGKESLMDNK